MGHWWLWGEWVSAFDLGITAVERAVTLYVEVVSMPTAVTGVGEDVFYDAAFDVKARPTKRRRRAGGGGPGKPAAADAHSGRRWNLAIRSTPPATDGVDIHGVPLPDPSPLGEG